MDWKAGRRLLGSLTKRPAAKVKYFWERQSVGVSPGLWTARQDGGKHPEGAAFKD